MSAYLPKDLHTEMAAAQRLIRRRRATRFVHVGTEAFGLVEFSEDSFAVDIDTTPHLRGLIDIYEGAAHIYQALIVASARDGDLMRYEFKRNTAALPDAPLDFETIAPRRSGFLYKA